MTFWNITNGFEWLDALALAAFLAVWLWLGWRIGHPSAARPSVTVLMSDSPCAKSGTDPPAPIWKPISDIQACCRVEKPFAGAATCPALCRRSCRNVVFPEAAIHSAHRVVSQPVYIGRTEFPVDAAKSTFPKCLFSCASI